MKKIRKKVFNLDEEKLECAHWKQRDLCLAGQDSRECCVFISDVAICIGLLVLPHSENYRGCLEKVFLPL